MYPESDLLPLSALQHLAYCERQCALIHVERLWRENRLTAEGQRLHKNAHAGPPKTRGGERTTRGLEVRSLALGLAGKCDVVLWTPPADLPGGVSLPEAWRRAGADQRRRWAVVPVEYKRGRPFQSTSARRGRRFHPTDDPDAVQLCAQALCLEEMLGVSIPAGRLFYGQTRRRADVAFDDALRGRTRSLAARLHELVRAGVTPPAEYEPAKCDRCSLKPDCLPELPLRRRSAAGWLDRQLEAALAE